MLSAKWRSFCLGLNVWTPLAGKFDYHWSADVLVTKSAEPPTAIKPDKADWEVRDIFSFFFFFWGGGGYCEVRDIFSVVLAIDDTDAFILADNKRLIGSPHIKGFV